jgi:hypothetical protein
MKKYQSQSSSNNHNKKKKMKSKISKDMLLSKANTTLEYKGTVSNKLKFSSLLKLDYQLFKDCKCKIQTLSFSKESLKISTNHLLSQKWVKNKQTSLLFRMSKSQILFQ